MFHRAKDQASSSSKNKPTPKTNPNKTALKPEQARQTALRKHIDTTPQNFETSRFINQNDAYHNEEVDSQPPYQVIDETTHLNNENSIQEKVKDNRMNNPEPQNKQPAAAENSTAPSQPRVDIPGNNFQRPGAAAQGSRPAYPGAYPGSAQPANAPATPSAVNSQPESAQLVIGRGISMSGEIEACDHLLVEGTVEAALKGARVLEISEEGAFFGTVEIDEADIAGRFEGDITVKGRLTIQSSGIVLGSISYKELAIEAGATIEGAISPIDSQNTTARRAPKKAAPAKSKKVQSNGAELPFADKSAAE